MANHRTLFYGEKSSQTPKKDGDNPLVPTRRFRRSKSDTIDIRFSNTSTTQFGGYPLWDMFCNRIALNQRLARHVRMQRGPWGFTAPELARFLIDAKALGVERLSHVDTLRLDPLLCQCAGMDGLPSGKTLGSFLKQHADQHRVGLDHLNTWFNNELWKRIRRNLSKTRRKAMERVILDYDSSTFAVYGKQDEADRGRSFRKKDKPGFQPRFAFLGGLGIAVHQELLPQSHNLNHDFLSFHKEALKRLPKTAKVWAVRGDGALYSEERVEYLEKTKKIYAISATMNPPLKEAVSSIAESAWEEAVDEQGHIYSVARIHYQPKTWKKKRTFIISRRLRSNPTGQLYLFEAEKYKYFAYVTNYRASVYRQFKFAVERCSLEGFIKEKKADFHYDFLPCQESNANHAYVAYVTLARNLSIFFRLLTAPATVNRWTFGTFQDRILRVCGNLRRQGEGRILSLPQWWPYQTIFEEVSERCRMLKPL